MTVLVTGGAGYIGSHTVLRLVALGYKVIIYDNFSNASKESIVRVEEISGKKIMSVNGDIRDKVSLSKIFEEHLIDVVIHFAGLKAVNESIDDPLRYYDNNVSGTITLCEVMQAYGCKSMIFSSSANVYGEAKSVPIKENFPTSATNAYGRSKLFIEQILKDIFVSDDSWKIIILRYFNPVGAHKSGKIGEDPQGIPTNLMPYIAQTAIGKLTHLNVFGEDYRTHDGTGVRDYIHVEDLAEGHVKALEKIQNIHEVLTVNLGTGKGYSVLDMVKAFEKASGKEIPYKMCERREGDAAESYTDIRLARDVLGWEAVRDLNEMCEDSWRWQSNNPRGYRNDGEIDG